MERAQCQEPEDPAPPPSWVTSSKALSISGPFSHWDWKAETPSCPDTLSPPSWALSWLSDTSRGLWSPASLPRALATGPCPLWCLFRREHTLLAGTGARPAEEQASQVLYLVLAKLIDPPPGPGRARGGTGAVPGPRAALGWTGESCVPEGSLHGGGAAACRDLQSVGGEQTRRAHPGGGGHGRGGR